MLGQVNKKTCAYLNIAEHDKACIRSYIACILHLISIFCEFFKNIFLFFS